MVRFLRGHGKVEAACAAYRAMVQYRIDRDVETVRQNILECGTIWPYLMDKFSPLLKGPWEGMMLRTNDPNCGNFCLSF